MPATQDHSQRPRGKRGFQRASSLLATRIRQTGETRGFAVARLLTHWAEVVGPEIARIARPVKVHYGRQGFGATLTLLTTGAQAPMLEMQKESIRQRVNACYGYAAISRVQLTQTAPSGFAEGAPEFTPAPVQKPAPDPNAAAMAGSLSRGVADADLRAALEALGKNVLSRPKR